jgi:hypothetical protein
MMTEEEKLGLTNSCSSISAPARPDPSDLQQAAGRLD